MDRLARLERALETIRDGIPRPTEGVTVYRDDGQPSKHDRCKHGFYMWEGCEECISEFAADALEDARSEVMVLRQDDNGSRVRVAYRIDADRQNPYWLEYVDEKGNMRIRARHRTLKAACDSYYYSERG